VREGYAPLTGPRSLPRAQHAPGDLDRPDAGRPVDHADGQRLAAEPALEPPGVAATSIQPMAPDAAGAAPAASRSMKKGRKGSASDSATPVSRAVLTCRPTVVTGVPRCAATTAASARAAGAASA
jgi:hypothetical protein